MIHLEDSHFLCKLAHISIPIHEKKDSLPHKLLMLFYPILVELVPLALCTWLCEVPPSKV